MAHSDAEYDDDDVVLPGRGGRSMVARPKERAQATWEAAASRNWELQEGADGGIEGVLGGLEEAGKRKRYATVLTFFIARRVLMTCKATERHNAAPTRHHTTYAPSA